jgi:RecA/RadA recombinase
MSELLKRLRKVSEIEHTEVMSESSIYNERDMIPTPIPGLNIAYSGSLDGGLTSGLHVWAGPSRHFKSLFCLVSAAAYLHKYPDAICIFYDNEFGTPASYFESVGIDPKRVLHVPFTTLEELRTDIVKMLKEIKRGDKVILVVDSLGLAASNKEVKDAEEGNEKADMTRAKVNKSLFRIVTPHLRLKDLPMLVVQHTYETMEMFSKTVVSGGTGTMLAADNVYILGRQQDKDGKELNGYNFIINIEKSRFVKDKKKIPILVRRTGGIARYGGLFDLALDSKLIHQNSAVSYSLVLPDGTVDSVKFRRKEVENDSVFWKKMLADYRFRAYVKETFSVSNGKLISTDDDDELVADEEAPFLTEELDEGIIDDMFGDATLAGE